jgi:hypothetical protein
MGDAGEEMRDCVQRGDSEALDELISSLQAVVEEAEGARLGRLSHLNANLAFLD